MDVLNSGAILSAVGLYNVFDDIHKKYFGNSKINLYQILNFVSANIVYVVDGALACEMAMKSAINENDARHLGHNLNKIYQSSFFDQKYKDAIKKSFILKGFTDSEFDNVLKESSNLFVTWRYFYERSNSGCHVPKYFYEFVTSCVETMVDFSELKREIKHEI